MSEEKESSSAEEHDRESSSEMDANAKFPVAKVLPAAKHSSLLQSRMWWATLGCLVLAIWLAWTSLPERAVRIVIRFPQGHGLKPGDSVQFRGIVVGEVSGVALSDDLSGVEAIVDLKPEGGDLNREGTRFWIVRPQISLAKVSGLDTAIGSKYIGVSLGPIDGERVTEFDGLANAPPDELLSGGLHLVLRSDKRNGLNAGAPVNWRGVEVGRVLGISLSPDAGSVLTSIHIDREYRALVRTGSKFWATSGLGLDIGLAGLKLNAESLATVTLGGVSFITVPDEQNSRVADGHVFPLANELDERWLADASNVSLVDFDLPKTVTVRYERLSSFLGITRRQKMTQSGILITGDDGPEILTPMFDIGESQTNVGLEVQAGATVFPVDAVAVDQVLLSDSGLIRFGVAIDPVGELASLAAFRDPKTSESCLLVRTAGADVDTVSLIHSVDAVEPDPDGGRWELSRIPEDVSAWHGAPVVSTGDGKLVGVLVVTPSGGQIATVNGEWKSVGE